MTKICLNMIVKDEEHVITRCLESVRPLIDYWVIADTGSSDQTKEMIQKTLKSIPGELHERPWVNFSHNRNEVLQLSKDKGDYLLFIDADDYLTFAPDFQLPSLTKDVYISVQQDKTFGLDTRWLLLARSQLNWRWEGMAHESLLCSDVQSAELLQGVTSIYGQDGSRSKDPEKSRKVIELLLQEWKKNPSDTKNIFYLAGCYFAEKEYDAAFAMYEKRSAMGGFEEEIFWCLYSMAKIEEARGALASVTILAYLKAHERRPSRLEPIYDLICLYRKIGEKEKAYQLAKKWQKASVPKDVIFVSRWIYEWGLLFQYMSSCYELQKKDECLSAAQTLLSLPAVPEHIKSQLCL